jgi:hypothetical protein
MYKPHHWYDWCVVHVTSVSCATSPRECNREEQVELYISISCTETILLFGQIHNYAVPMLDLEVEEPSFTCTHHAHKTSCNYKLRLPENMPFHRC